MTSSIRTIAALTVSALLTSAAPALAQPAGPAHEGFAGLRAEMLAKYDKNKDGKLDDTERATMKVDHFKALDKDGDGKVKRAEFPAAVEAARNQARTEHELALFDKMDTNKDGVVTDAEFQAFKPAHDGDHPFRGPREHRHGDGDGK